MGTSCSRGLTVFSLLLWTWGTLGAEEKSLLTQEQSEKVCGTLWEALESHRQTHYSPKTHLLYSTPLDRLPSASQVRDLYPNPVGYGTGMEDCTMYAGTLLVAWVELFDLTGDDSLRARAYDTYLGLRAVGTAHGVRGFVSRGICPEDGASTYITSSRDQVTHYVEGLWRYFRSPLCDDGTRQEIRGLLTDLADVMAAQIRSENDYGFLRADGSKDPRGLHKMWHVYAHEAARLPMIYAAAWDASGDAKYRALYETLAHDAVDQSLTLNSRPLPEVNAWVPTYSFYQMQCSLDVMLRVEKDTPLKDKTLHAMNAAKDFASIRLPGLVQNQNLQQFADIHIAQLVNPSLALTPEQKTHLVNTLTHRKLKHTGVSGTCHLLRAYAHACRNGYVPIPRGKMPPAVDVRRTALPSVTWKTLPPQPEVDEHLIVLLGDAHLGAELRNLDRLQNAANLVLQMRPRPAMILLTGDLAAHGTPSEYALASPVLKRFADARIPVKCLLGEADRREALAAVLPEDKLAKAFAPNNPMAVLEHPRADFLLLNTAADEAGRAVLADEQKRWLGDQARKYAASRKPFFVVSHHPPARSAAAEWLSGSATFLAWLHGHEHRWTDKPRDAPRTLGLPSVAYSADGAPHEGFCTLKMDKWEFIFRPVTYDQDDVWARRVAVFRLHP
ncbi:MAG: hypothetical protein GX575_33435 [Candidatus Anammoximicrobium sp.]|nr:hypothetical protein [Candidatus Anammoximicrobium sp.]